MFDLCDGNVAIETSNERAIESFLCCTCFLVDKVIIFGPPTGHDVKQTISVKHTKLLWLF